MTSSNPPTALDRDENPSFVPLRHAVIITSAKPGTIRQWARRLQLSSVCDVRSRHVHYAIPDLVRLERATRERNEARSLTSAA